MCNFHCCAMCERHSLEIIFYSCNGQMFTKHFLLCHCSISVPATVVLRQLSQNYFSGLNSAFTSSLQSSFPKWLPPPGSLYHSPFLDPVPQTRMRFIVLFHLLLSVPPSAQKLLSSKAAACGAEITCLSSGLPGCNMLKKCWWNNKRGHCHTQW